MFMGAFLLDSLYAVSRFMGTGGLAFGFSFSYLVGGRFPDWTFLIVKVVLPSFRTSITTPEVNHRVHIKNLVRVRIQKRLRGMI